MSKATSVLIRFRAERTKDKAALDRLNQLQKQTHQSQSQIVIAALNAYRPDEQTQSELLVQRITESVIAANKQTLPAIIEDCLARLTIAAETSQRAKSTTKAYAPISPSPIPSISDTVSQQDYSGVNWDFVGG